jgi:hypothetical protein
VCAAKIVQIVPDLDAKFYAATQVIDEARHVEAYDRYLREKITVSYPVSQVLRGVLSDVVADPRWDMTCLGMQVLIEGLAIAAFSIQRDHMRDPLARTFNALILADESRHVAFGRLALRDYYRELSSSELREREEFAAETCWALRDRFTGEEMWENLDIGHPGECVAYAKKSPAMREFRYRLFVSIRKSCERACCWPAWRLSAAMPVIVLSVRVFYPGGGGCAQVARSSGFAFQGRKRSSAGPVRAFLPFRPHSSR